LAAIAGLAYAWPSLAAKLRVPRLDDWCPESDAGVLLQIHSAGHREAVGQGARHWFLEFTADDGDGCARLDSCSYVKGDGVPGGDGERVKSVGNIVAPKPLATQSLSGRGYGFADGYSLQATFTYERRGAVSSTAGPPPVLGKRDGSWHELALDQQHDVALRWCETTSDLIVRAERLVRGKGAAIADGTLAIDGKRVTFAAGEARIPLAETGSRWVGRPLHVTVDLDFTGAAGRLTVTLGLP
jgi:hypothetical protein